MRGVGEDPVEARGAPLVGVLWVLVQKFLPTP